MIIYYLDKRRTIAGRKTGSSTIGSGNRMIPFCKTLKWSKVAWPLAFSAIAPDMAVLLSLKVTVPVVTGLPELVTVAVNVTLLSGAVVKEGFRLDKIVVTVGAATPPVIVRLHPPEMTPTSPPASSTINSFHIPLGETPLNLLANVAVPPPPTPGAASSAG